MDGLSEFDRGRGRGRTTKQLRDAKPNAVFFCCNDSTNDFEYTKRLALSLGRADIRIMRPRDWEHLRGLRFPEIVIDHAAGKFSWPEEVYAGIRACATMARPN